MRDAEIQKLNREFLGCARPTDVIAFAGDGDLGGEIAVSVDTAGRQAAERGVPLGHELMLLATHGFLHIMGHDDCAIKDWRMMRIAEFEAMTRIL